MLELSIPVVSTCPLPPVIYVNFVPLPPAPGVWLMYAQFAVQKMDKFEEGIAFPRNVFERAITASGLHASKVTGNWELTREYSLTAFNCSVYSSSFT